MKLATWIPAVALAAGCGASGTPDEGRAPDRDPGAAAPAAAAENEWGGAMDAPPDASWSTTIASEDEPGERIVITGTVFQEDGATPAKDVLLYAYHTNAQGVYPKTRPDDGTLRWRHGALRGFVRTGEDGRYEIRTIRPAPYPGGSVPAHIHVTVTAPGVPEYWIEDVLFEGDPFLTPSHRRGDGRSGFPHVVALSRDEAGVLRGTRNIRIVRGLE